MNRENIGREIAKLRKAQGMTSTELARRVGLSQAQISRLETGKQGFRSDTLKHISQALGVSTAFFFQSDAENTHQARRRERTQRAKAGEDSLRKLQEDAGEIVFTTGFKTILRRLARLLKRPETDHRSLQKLLARIFAMSSEERLRLLEHLNRNPSRARKASSPSRGGKSTQ